MCRGTSKVMDMVNKGVGQHELALLTQDALAININESMEKELDKQIIQGYSRKLSRNFTVRVLYGEHPLKPKKTYAVSFQCNIGEKESYGVFMSEILSDRKEVKEKILSDLNDMATLNDMDYKRIRDYVVYLRDNDLVNQVKSLIPYVEDKVGNVRAREDYFKLNKYLFTNRHLIASRSKNDYDSEEHIGVLLDDRANINKYGEIVVALRSSSIWSILGQSESEDSTSRMGINTQLFNGIKRGLNDIGVLIWHGKDARKKTTVAVNKTEQCLIFKINGVI